MDFMASRVINLSCEDGMHLANRELNEMLRYFTSEEHDRLLEEKMEACGEFASSVEPASEEDLAFDETVSDLFSSAWSEDEEKEEGD